MLELVSGILRQVLQSERRQEVTLDEKLRFIEKYLAIEQVRFSDRLKVTWLIEDAVRNALVPEFILQPLVENAIRHGVAKLSEDGKVQVAARRWNDSLVLSVRDNGPGYQPASDDQPPLFTKKGRGKQALILVPGLYSGASSFDGLIARNQSRYKFYVVTPPGIYGTPARPIPAAVSSFSEMTWTRRLERDILDLIRRDKINKPVIVSDSYPSSIAAIELGVEHPDKIGGVVLAGPSR